MIDTTTSPPILFFDGVCNLCNGLVQFLLRHDKKKLFHFAALQSAAGKDAVQKMANEHKTAPDSVILLYKGTYYMRSTAGLHIFKLLGWPWKLLYAGIIAPRFLRDGIYNFISRNRYKWFGKRDACMVPTRDIMDRFL